MKNKIQINNTSGKLLFELEIENNTIDRTIRIAIRNSIDLTKADFRDTDLRCSDFNDIDLRYADFSRANLRHSNFKRANISNSNFNNADLSNADFGYSILRDANCSNANISESNFSNSDLMGAIFLGSNLSNTDFRNSDLSYINFIGADISNSYLSGACLKGSLTDKRYIQISCIGRGKRMTTYCFEDDIIWCGCFKDNLANFKSQVKKIHANNDQYLKEYLGFIDYIESLK